MKSRTAYVGEKTFSNRIRKGFARRSWEYIFNSARYAATRDNRNYNWGITYEEFLKFVEQKICHYCGDNIPWPLPHGGRDALGNYRSGHHLDRKDNAKGYSVRNCVVACACCNRTKGNMLSYEEMLVIGKMRRDKRENARAETTCAV